ncbi:tRNA (guanine(46)-N(7))-methyltransferase TrmB [Aestuariibacter salexigens]|uniref:tRNA (guanine(46)-N(7))-methyltransferase TrmB n=1 Tax=Aestuariibacter salexigens TaxID=226010 RepID=UPI000421807D|nr:SAM-dependent methyltransferase [Aestuariibacter salexigens]
MHTGRDSEIVTSQHEPHESLDRLVTRYQQSEFNRPIGSPTQEAYEKLLDWLGNYRGTVVLDSCCGVGESTAKLARRHADSPVIGVDKSAMRTNKHMHYGNEQDNYCVIRADVIDLWRLLHNDGWTLSHHYLLYPNPYPKARQVQKRWHAGPSFPTFVALGGVIEVRSNWRLYLDEFKQSLCHYAVSSSVESFVPDVPLTPFERKYNSAGQTLWRLKTF